MVVIVMVVVVDYGGDGVWWVIVMVVVYGGDGVW